MKTNKKWCKHFKYSEDQDCNEHTNCGGFIINDGTEMWADDDWKYCPLCGKKRP